MAELEAVEQDTAGDRVDRSQELQLMLAKSLLDANAHTVRAFEQHLLQTYCTDAVLESASVQSNIRQAISEHERIIEELEAASRAVAELEQSPESTTSR